MFNKFKFKTGDLVWFKCNSTRGVSVVEGRIMREIKSWVQYHGNEVTSFEIMRTDISEVLVVKKEDVYWKISDPVKKERWLNVLSFSGVVFAIIFLFSAIYFAGTSTLDMPNFLIK